LSAIVSIQEGGLVIYGCVLAGAAALFIFVKKHKMPGYAIADLIAPGLMIGLAFGRIGCFLNGCCFGGVCELPWAVRFPAGSPPHFRQVERGMVYLYGVQVADTTHPATDGSRPQIVHVDPNSQASQQGVRPGDRVLAINEQSIHQVDDAWNALIQALRLRESVDLVTDHGRAILDPLKGADVSSLPVHPTQLYSVFDAALLSWFLLAYEPFRRRDGEDTAWVCTIYPITRFLVEILRSDEPAVLGTGFTISQNISLAVFVYGVLLWIWLLRRPPKLAWPLLRGFV
ncbi:MAG TPA: prolipoprotein diacylglyceryl transferase family protein, partial [Pirellulales bacterium]|nr:prolipoprotein diacylglyceryl transferase family protein [Pirellulales bacterium]